MYPGSFLVSMKSFSMTFKNFSMRVGLAFMFTTRLRVFEESVDDEVIPMLVAQNENG